MLMLMVMMGRTRDVAPAAGDDTPVGTSKVAVAQSVADRVYGTVDVAQPVTCQHAHRLLQVNRQRTRLSRAGCMSVT